MPVGSFISGYSWSENYLLSFNIIRIMLITLDIITLFNVLHETECQTQVTCWKQDLRCALLPLSDYPCLSRYE